MRRPLLLLPPLLLLAASTFLPLLPGVVDAGFSGGGSKKSKSAAAAAAASSVAKIGSGGGGSGSGSGDCDGDPPADAATKRVLTPADLAIAGALATVVGDAALHPIDCVKTLQQSGEGAALSFAGATRKIWTDSGAGGFYSGLGTYVAADGGAGAVKFAAYEVIKRWAADRIPDERYFGAALFGCAAAAYMASSAVLIPGELIKQRMQMGQAASFASAVSSIWKSDGPAGFFAGYQGVWLRDIPYTALELGIYDNVKALFLRYRNRGKTSPDDGGGCATSISRAEEIVAGGISGGITGYVTNPLDLVKTKLMVEGDLYSGGFLDALRGTFEAGGLPALFHGGAARVAYILPFCALYLPVYEAIKRRMERAGGVPRRQRPPPVATVSTGKKKKGKAAAEIGRGGAQKRTGGGFGPIGPRRRRRRIGAPPRPSGLQRLDGVENFVGF